VSLANVDILVLDEVDRMLDMGFLPDVKRIVQKTPNTRQTLFFTATVPPEIASLASWALKDPARVEIGRQRSVAETIAHAFYPVVASRKFDLLQLLLEQTDFKSVIIFAARAWARTALRTDSNARATRSACCIQIAVNASALRRWTVSRPASLKCWWRRISRRAVSDIAGVSHVINYDVPENAEDYVHRIGRTGRAHASGDAFTLVTGRRRARCAQHRAVHGHGHASGRKSKVFPTSIRRCSTRRRRRKWRRRRQSR